MVPTAAVIAALINPTSPDAESLTRDLKAATATLGLTLHVLHASSARDFDTAFATLLQLRAGALVIVTDALFISRSEQLAALTVRHRVPAIFQYLEFVSAGGLMSYAGSGTEPSRRVGVYTGRILKGEKPADLPVLQSTKFEFVINLQTARELGIEVAPAMLSIADEVIE
jgi:putative ABC transport system substrate-binding protein